jgi:hypothetical protein
MAGKKRAVLANELAANEVTYGLFVMARSMRA